MFVIRPRLDLLNPEHITWLRETCLRLDITMLILDTWTALSPAADPLGTKDQAELAAVVVRLCEDIGGLLIVVDHSRKNRPDGQPLSPADIVGPPQKWAAAEHIVMLDVVEGGRRLEVFIEVLLDRQPQGSPRCPHGSTMVHVPNGLNGRFGHTALLSTNTSMKSLEEPGPTFRSKPPRRK